MGYIVQVGRRGAAWMDVTHPLVDEQTAVSGFEGIEVGGGIWKRVIERSEDGTERVVVQDLGRR